MIKDNSRSAAFIKSVINYIENDKAAAAALRRADNQSTEFQSWQYILPFCGDFTNRLKRLPFQFIGAAMVKGKITRNGSLRIGEAIARCYEDGSQSNQAKAKLRRLLACDSVNELCTILRPLLRLIQEKCKMPLDYERLLAEVLQFEFEDQQIKARWAQSFYRSNVSEEV